MKREEDSTRRWRGSVGGRCSEGRSRTSLTSYPPSPLVVCKYAHRVGRIAGCLWLCLRGTRRRNARHRSIPHTTRHLGSELTEDSTRTTHEGSPFPPAFSFSVHATAAFLLPSFMRNQRRRRKKSRQLERERDAQERKSETVNSHLTTLPIKRAHRFADRFVTKSLLW